MKELNLTDKDFLRKKLAGHIKNFQVLLIPFVLTVILAYVAFYNNWVGQTFPSYLVLLSLFFLFILIVFAVETARLRKAINSPAKTIVAGKITRKFQTSDEYSTDCFFVVRGKKHEIECEQYNAFKEGDYVKLEFSSAGNELICVKPIKQNMLLHRAYRKAKIRAKKLRK